MPDTDTTTRKPPPDRDPTTRKAALWATLVAVPVAAIVGFVVFTQIIPDAAPQAQETQAAAPNPIPSTPVQMEATALTGRTAQVCLAVTAQLPTKVRDLQARPVSAGPEQNAAYGEPAVTVACGVAKPAMCETLDGGPDCVPLDAELMRAGSAEPGSSLDKVCWWANKTPTATELTTLDREVPIRVTVPDSYAQPAQWANEFTQTLTATDKPITDGLPSGCRG